MSNIEHWIGVRMAAGYDDEDFRDLMRMVNTMSSVAEAVVAESAEVPQPVEADRAGPMRLIEQCDTLITLIRHGVEAWRDGDGDVNTAHATLSNIEQLDKRVHQLAGRETALQRIRDHGQTRDEPCSALHRGDCADVMQEIARAALRSDG